MNYRRLGKTDLNISIIAYGGLPLFLSPLTGPYQPFTRRLMKESIILIWMRQGTSSFPKRCIWMEAAR